MGTKALPHAGIGVKSYAWSTSPLRRYTDLVNQWQIIAAARHGKTAALAAPFKPKDADLFSIISGFDAAYAAYNGYQAGMERFWTLKYLQQQGIDGTRRHRVQAKAWCAPTTCRWCCRCWARSDLPRGARVRVQLGEIDEITLDVHGTVLERLDAAPPAAVGGRRRRRGGRTRGRPDRHRGRRRGRRRSSPMPGIIRLREPASPSAPCRSRSASRSPCMPPC